jgi:hypothetical protein
MDIRVCGERISETANNKGGREERNVQSYRDTQ